MWKLALIFLVAAFGSIHAQDPIQLACNFQFSIFNEYTCLLEEIEILEENAAIEMIGVHVEGMTDAYVVTLQIRGSNMPFMVQSLITWFPNLYELDIENSNLQSINVPETIQLRWLILNGNNITRLEAGSIRDQQRLHYLELVYNGIQSIDEDAFVDLGTISSLVLHNNQISEIVGTTFHPLTTALYIDLDRNNLVSLHDRTFTENQNAVTFYLQYNQINEIHPDWVLELEHTLRSVDLRNNNCIDSTFSLVSPEGWLEMHQALQNCYDNFLGIVRDRRITMEFSGPMVIYDEFGNVIARI